MWKTQGLIVISVNLNLKPTQISLLIVKSIIKRMQQDVKIVTDLSIPCWTIGNILKTNQDVTKNRIRSTEGGSRETL